MRAVLQCTSQYFCHPGLIQRGIIHFYLSLVSSFCTTGVQTALSLLPLLTSSSQTVGFKALTPSFDSCVFPPIFSHLSHLFMTLTSTSGGGAKGLGYPFYSGASGGSVYLFLSLRREISWVCWRISFSSRLVKSEYSSSWISIRLVWFSTYATKKGGDSSTVGRE